MSDEEGDREAIDKVKRSEEFGDEIVVYATFPDEAKALATAEALVAAGLVACANIVPGIISVCIWEGRLEREREVAMLMKTRRALADDVITAVTEMHPYDNPAVVAWTIVAGSAEYLRWIDEQTAGGKAPLPPKPARKD